MDKKVSINKLFELQDRCFVFNKKNVVNESLFIEEAIDLVVNRIISGEFTKDEVMKFKIIHQLLDTALSSLINSYKLILYGCPGDALALLRIAFESVVFQDYAVVFNDYDKVKKEIIEGKGKFDFKEALARLEAKEKTNRGRLFGFLSGLGSHLTSDRMQYNYFEIDGKKFPITAHSIVKKEILEQVIHAQMQVALYMVNVLVEFRKKIKPDAIKEDFFKEAILLKEKYDSFK